MPEGPDDVVRLGRRGLTWRVVLTVLGVLLAVNGTLRGVDDHWPFAPMSQFAFRVDPDDVVRDTRIDALTSAGTVVEVPLNTAGVGINRAQIEGNLEQIEARPSRMSGVAEGWRRLHPGEPPYVELYLRQNVVELDGGVPGPAHDVTLATWRVGTP